MIGVPFTSFRLAGIACRDVSTLLFQKITKRGTPHKKISKEKIILKHLGLLMSFLLSHTLFSFVFLIPRSSLAGRVEVPFGTANSFRTWRIWRTGGLGELGLVIGG